jgi:hypothetical protein
MVMSDSDNYEVEALLKKKAKAKAQARAYQLEVEKLLPFQKRLERYTKKVQYAQHMITTLIRARSSSIGRFKNFFGKSRTISENPSLTKGLKGEINNFKKSLWNSARKIEKIKQEVEAMRNA